MGGIQGKPCGEVAQHVGNGFHIHPCCRFVVDLHIFQRYTQNTEKKKINCSENQKIPNNCECNRIVIASEKKSDKVYSTAK